MNSEIRAQTKIAKMYLIALGATLLGFGISGDAAALGIGESGNYSKNSNCLANSSKDPVGVVFYGSHGHAAGAAAAVQQHAGWGFSSGGLQGLRVHQGGGNYRCRQTDHQRANGLGTRYHIRLWFVDATANSSVKKSVGTPHHEDVVVWPEICGHAVDKNGPNGSGFDQGRRRVSEKMWDGGHTGQQNQWWGNTANFKQCDGDYAGSAGVGVLIPINHGH